MDVTNAPKNILLEENTQKSAGLIPLTTRLAELCQLEEKQERDTTKQKPECKREVNRAVDKLALLERLIKYYAILGGIADTCVKADLDTKPHINATTIHDTKERLYICTGAYGGIKFRAPYKSRNFVRVKETFTSSIVEKPAVVTKQCLDTIPLTEKCDLKRAE